MDYHDPYKNGYSELLFPSVYGFSFQDETMDDYIMNLEGDIKEEVLLRRNEFRSRADVEAFVDFYEENRIDR